MEFVIVGNGVAGVTAAMALRRREPRAGITLVSGEADYFFSRTALMYAFMDRMRRKDLEPFERKVYDQQGIRRVRDWVVDLDAGQRLLRLEGGSTLRYDGLLLATGSTPNRPSWPGLDGVREGVAHFVSMQDLDECERLTRSTRQAVVVGGGLIGVELVECLRFHGREVTFLVKDPWYWPAALGGPEAEMVSAHLRRHGVDLRTGEQVTEVVAGDNGRVRAIRTNAGGEHACQMLGIAVGVRPAVEWLRRVATPPELGVGIRVTPGFATSLPGVWAAGDCAEFVEGERPFVEQIWYSAKRHGELAAVAMLGDAVEYRMPIFYNSSKFFEIEYTTVGLVNQAPKGSVEFYHRVEGKEASVRIVANEGGAVVGFNMLGSRWDHTFFERWIAQRRTMDAVMERLHEAQFDHEFGRLDLRPVRAAYAERRVSLGAPVMARVTRGGN